MPTSRRRISACASAQADLAALVASQLYDSSHGVVLLGDRAHAAEVPRGWASLDGRRVALADAHAEIRRREVGKVDGYALPPHETPADVDDLWTVDLSEVGGRVRARAGSAGTKALGVAGLTAAGAIVDPTAVLSETLGVPVRVVGTEAEAARLGALSTPRAPDDAVVVDLGGGTIDVVTKEHAVVAAGAGDLLTLCVAELTGTTAAAAEHVKRGPSRRAEAPQVVLGEDGRRSFLETPIPSDAIGSLIVGGPAGWLAFGPDLAPSEWRALRLDLKIDLVGGNITRALRTLARDLAGTILLVGGPAADEEVLAAVAGALPSGAAVARGDVGGAFGHRYAVAYGLLLLAKDLTTLAPRDARGRQ